MDDCFVLDFDPYNDTINLHDPQNTTHVHDGHGDNDKEDICIIADKVTLQENVACRDYPHPRNLCYKFPFDTTLHSDYCEQCYCYVCETVAPCDFWSSVDGCEESHCNASEDKCYWTNQRNLKHRSSRPTFGSFYSKLE
ncbi:hypothetical protein EZV62_024371 [Acer yangbiense]|uniref:Uncharacterized protein n=1 Tax=Acer yangbiense TaxID=1000413 RepID=A0A5C7GWM7_9ROSI|nr:hypothetical protein EZV62_024371 [Acer yangbiense]